MTGSHDLASRPRLAWSTSTAPPDVCLWADDRRATARPALDADTTADVVVVGAGFAGLWTACALLDTDPGLDVLVVEAGRVGDGSGGRGTGVCAARFPGDLDTMSQRWGEPAVQDLRAAVRDAVVEVGGLVAADQLDCDFGYAGALTVACEPGALRTVHLHALDAARWDDEVRTLDADAVRAVVRVDGALGGAWTPNCATVHPVRLLDALADQVVSRGGRVVEGTRARRVAPGAVVTDQGIVRTGQTVCTTGAQSLAGAPATSRVRTAAAVATEPLPAEDWERIGLGVGQALAVVGAGSVQMVRTADDRLVAVGPGPTPRRWPGRGRASDTGRSAPVDRALERLLGERAPGLVTHRWSVPLAVPGRTGPVVGVAGASEGAVAWVDGLGLGAVALANLAGRTVADLLTGSSTALTRLPWVERRAA